VPLIASAIDARSWAGGLGEGHTVTNFFGTPAAQGEGPQSYIVSLGPGHELRGHFHVVDQYQVFFAGSGRVGKHEVGGRIAIHYADAFTPYGPIVASEQGVSYKTVRIEHDPGAQYMPESREKMERQAGLAFTIELDPDPAPPPRTEALVSVVDPLETGLAVHRARVAAGESVALPDPSDTGGQMAMVLAGSILWEGQEHPAPSDVFVAPTDAGTVLVAGPEGLDAIVLAFPRKGESSRHSRRAFRATREGGAA
jgi:hypothetical protein